MFRKCKAWFSEEWEEPRSASVTIAESGEEIEATERLNMRVRGEGAEPTGALKGRMERLLHLNPIDEPRQLSPVFALATEKESNEGLNVLPLRKKMSHTLRSYGVQGSAEFRL